MKKTTEKSPSPRKKAVAVKNENQITAAELPRIVLTGFMGAGKTTLGQLLAESLEAIFIDLDEYFEVSENRTIPQLMATLGEETFREIEAEKLREVLTVKKTKIIALGGGTFTIAENRAMLKHDGSFVVWLDAPFELCWRRIKAEKKERPLAQTKKEARTLYETRREIYAAADFTLEISGGKKPAAQISEILAKVSSQSKAQ